jgi:hypothetical protein
MGFTQPCPIPVFEDNTVCIEWENSVVLGQVWQNRAESRGKASRFGESAKMRASAIWRLGETALNWQT